MRVTPSIVISGYYGFGNTGDEAVLDGILATFAEIGLDERITVLSGSPAQTAAAHESVKAIHRYSPTGVLRALRGADLVISGGGSLLQDATSSRSLYYYLYVLRLAQVFRRKTMIYAQGIGPLKSEKSKRAVGRVLKRASAVTVRDSDSLSVIESLGVAGARVVADPSFLAQADMDAADAVLASCGLSGRPLLGISIRPWADNAWLPELAGSVRVICDLLGLTPVLIPMQPGEDARLCAEIDLGPLVGGNLPPQAVKGLIARCSLMIGMRLHSLMFAADTGVPFVALVYDPKVRAFAKESVCPGVLDVGAGIGRDLQAAAEQTWENRRALRESLLKRATELRRSALEPGEIARRLVEGTDGEP